MPAKYVIHTVGPVWRGGNNGEESLLRACYINSFKIAKEQGIKSIAFPLISAGVYGYPKKAAIDIAVGEIERFLEGQDATVYLVLFDLEAYEIAGSLYAKYCD